MGNYISPSVVSPTSYTVTTWTLRQIIEQAYRMAGALKHPGQGISNSESQEGLDIFNMLTDGLKIENLLVIFYIRTVVDCLTGQKDYGVGPGQNWDIERPEKIHTAGFIVQPDTQNESEIPMQILLTYQDYAMEVVKSTRSTIPLVLYYQATLPYGTGTIWPVASIDSKIALYTQGAFQEIQNIDYELVVPKGWKEMLLYQMAVRVHQRYPNKPMDPTVLSMSTFYKERVKNQQLTPIYMGSDQAVLNRRFGYTGSFPKTWTPYT